MNSPISPATLSEGLIFKINSTSLSISSCDFSKYRLVLNGDNFYPCYTQHILALPIFGKEEIVNNPRHCLDCACIYENDMLKDIETKRRRYKNPSFALEYVENGK